MAIEHIKPKIKFYKDKKGYWRWSLIAANGRVLADSGEGYQRRRNCEGGAEATSLALGKLLGPGEQIAYKEAPLVDPLSPVSAVDKPRRRKIFGRF